MQLWFAHKTEVTLRQQLVTQIVLGILSGELEPGQRLPSTRELARRFRLHPNTVSSGYRQLVRSRLRHWLELQPPDRFLVVEPDEELRQILSLEVERGVTLPVRSCGLADLRMPQTLDGAIPLALPTKTKAVR